MGVMRDPYHGDILKALAGHLDPEVFEQCAVDLLSPDWPGLAPIRGGRDDGFDGAVPAGAQEEPFPLIVTTSKELNRNLKRSIKRARRAGWSVDRTLFATARRITPPTRRTLFETARKLGVRLVQTFDQDWFALRIYREPEWSKRLLGLTGQPRALSVYPVTQRPVYGDEVLGREREMRWLLDRSSDGLLVGGPGSGKTFLLRSLALQGQALFVVDPNRKQIANDLRHLRPAAIIVDDAHIDPGAITNLLQLRQEIGAEEVRIIATSWPAEAKDVASALRLSSENVLQLEGVDQDTMIEIIKSVGLQGPDELLHVIQKQAAGRPGLAVTLAHLCLAGDVQQVASGDSLVDRLTPDLDRRLGVDTSRLLAPFALGGNAGVQQDVVARCLGISTFELSTNLARLAAAGIVRERRNRAISVEPPAMRWVLVRRVFFGGAGSLDIAPLMKHVQSQEDALYTLIGARARGAIIPDLEDRLEHTASTHLWSEYASLGPSETRFVVHHHPDLIVDIASVTLDHAPETVIPMLLDRASKKDQQRGPWSEDPIQELEDWATGVSPVKEDILYRRSTLVRAANRWWQQGGESSLTIRAMCIALSPGFKYTATDPGAGRRFTWTHGVLREHELQALSELWPAVIEVVRGASATSWRDVFQLARNWLHPDPRVELPEGARSTLRALVERMLHDLADTSRQHPGVQHRLQALTEEADFTLDLNVDPEFEVLYPHERFEEEDDEHLRAQHVDDLAERWGNRAVEDIATSLAQIEAEAQSADINYPRESPRLCHKLAQSHFDPLFVLDVFMQHDLPADLVQPFASKAATEERPGWISLVKRCIDETPYRWVGVSIALTHPNPPEELLTAALAHAGEMHQLVETCCSRGEVPETTVHKMWRAKDSRVAVAAAIGHWHAARRGKTPNRLSAAWRHAILRSVDEGSTRSHDEYWLGKILSKDGELAEKWLLSVLNREDATLRYGIQEVATKAVSSLDLAQRRRVLAAVRSGFGTADIVEHLIGESLELYGELLRATELRRYHLAPLAGMPDKPWQSKALLALDADYSTNDIVAATLGQGWSWSGPESAMWAGWRSAFEELVDDSDSRISRIGERGVEVMVKRQQKALQEERREAVYGR
jgi:hypothetical protein